MSHRYPTRFQLKKAHAVQPAVLQAQSFKAAASQSVASQTEVVQDELKLMMQQEASSAVVNYFLDRASSSTSYFDKVRETIKLFEYLYEQPVLLTTHPRFKDTTWHKMSQLDNEMTDVLMRIPSTIEFDLYDHGTRTNIARLHNLLNMIRQKYY